MIFSVAFILFGTSLVAWQLWSNSKIQGLLAKSTGLFLILTALSSIYQVVSQNLSWGAFSATLMLLSISSFVARLIPNNLKTKALYLASSSLLLSLFIASMFLNLGSSKQHIE